MEIATRRKLPLRNVMGCQQLTRDEIQEMRGMRCAIPDVQ